MNPESADFTQTMMNPINILGSTFDYFNSGFVSFTNTNYSNSEQLVSDDIWKKFDLDFPELSGIDDVFEELDSDRENALIPMVDGQDELILRNKNCMWTGLWISKDQPDPVDEPYHSPNYILSKPPGVMINPPPPPLKPQNQQQSVLKPALRPSAVIQHTPQTPPESDDEENKAKPTQVLQILNQAINECDLEDDTDLCEYFEDDNVGVKEESIDIKEEPLDVQEEELDVKEETEDQEDEEEEEEEQEEVVNVSQHANKSFDYKSYKQVSQMAAVNDHSYHKDKNASMMHHTSYGLDTPSDSDEEEIDVVSVSDKLVGSPKLVCNLPTNPSTRDRQQLQRRMATAIKRPIHSGIKTILPVRKSTATQSTTPKRRQTESRGQKKSRGYRSNAAAYKKRSYGHTNWSDSDPEPSEKRSLHNNMERQRRIDLRNAFEDLRVLVPEVSKKDRAAKVVILREAALYCDHLGNVSSNYLRQKEDLKKQQEWLRLRVSQLRRKLAAIR